MMKRSMRSKCMFSSHNRLSGPKEIADYCDSLFQRHVLDWIGKSPPSASSPICTHAYGACAVCQRVLARLTVQYFPSPNSQIDSTDRWDKIMMWKWQNSKKHHELSMRCGVRFPWRVRTQVNFPSPAHCLHSGQTAHAYTEHAQFVDVSKFDM